MANINSRREHLYRKHIRPTHLCDRCFENFKDNEGLQRHLGSHCEGKMDCPYLNPDQQLQLKAATMRGMQECQKWEHMYRILFPGDELIPSPCVCYYPADAGWLFTDTTADRNELCTYNTHVERLRSAIVCILNNADAHEDSNQTIQQIIDATLQVIRSISGTAVGEQGHYPQKHDEVEDADAMARHITEDASAGNTNNQEHQFFWPGEATNASFRPGATDEYMGAVGAFREDSFEGL